jgi:hypothetical protein
VLSTGLGIDGVADRVGVDRKTVERWISGRVPYRRHQYALASTLDLEVAYLWPDARQSSELAAIGQAEVLAIYPHRSVTPPELWMDTFRQAETHLDVLVYAGFWLSEDPTFHRLLRSKAEQGTNIRILLGDPASDEVSRRSLDEGIGDSTIPGKIRNAIVNYRKLIGVPGIEFRLHRTILYNSIYRADDHMLVTPHVLGVGAYLAPTIHLCRLPGADLFSMYLDSFNAVWSSSTALDLDADRVA